MLNSDFTLSQAMYECRAMRRLKADPVSDEVLIDLVDAANQAASGSNAQMARWIVVKDPAQKRKLADLNRLHGEPYIASDRENPRDDKQRRLLDAVIWQMDHMHEYPLSRCLL